MKNAPPLGAWLAPAPAASDDAYVLLLQAIVKALVVIDEKGEGMEVLAEAFVEATRGFFFCSWAIRHHHHWFDNAVTDKTKSSIAHLDIGIGAWLEPFSGEDVAIPAHRDFDIGNDVNDVERLADAKWRGSHLFMP